jgi:hypothetical protein
MPVPNTAFFFLAASGSGTIEDVRRQVKQEAFDMVFLGHSLARESHAAAA